MTEGILSEFPADSSRPRSAPQMLWDLAEGITSCYVQVLFWLDPVALTTKEDGRPERDQEANMFVANFPPML